VCHDHAKHFFISNVCVACGVFVCLHPLPAAIVLSCHVCFTIKLILHGPNTPFGGLLMDSILHHLWARHVKACQHNMCQGIYAGLSFHLFI
jgi:hypothetical protein